MPAHPKVAALLKPVKKAGLVFRAINERTLLRRLKQLCAACGFDDPQQYKLHSFRHHFASLCANSHVAHRKALAWMGRSSSEVLDLYYHLDDEDSQQTMMALAGAGESTEESQNPDSNLEGNSRATGGSRIEKSPQPPEAKQLVTCLNGMAEREGYSTARFRNSLPFRWLALKCLSRLDLRIPSRISFCGYLFLSITRRLPIHIPFFSGP